MTHSSNSRHYSRFIPSEEVGDVTQWHFSAVDGSEPVIPVVVEAEPELPLPPPGIDEAEHLAKLEQAREEGYERGVVQGQAQAGLEWQQRMDDYVANQGREAAERMDQLAGALDTSLNDMQQRMAQEVLALACDIARQVIRQELAGQPDALLPVVREALGMLISEGRPATVRLSPQDWETLEQPLREEFAASKVQWIADAHVQPGDCQVESAGTVVDGSLDKRWRRAIAALGLTSAWKEGHHGD
jgi:flagellar assembly protein FliH